MPEQKSLSPPCPSHARHSHLPSLSHDERRSKESRRHHPTDPTRPRSKTDPNKHKTHKRTARHTMRSVPAPMESPLFDTPIRDTENSFASEVLKELARFDEAFLYSRPSDLPLYAAAASPGDEEIFYHNRDSYLGSSFAGEGGGGGGGAKKRLSRTLSFKRDRRRSQQQQLQLQQQQQQQHHHHQQQQLSDLTMRRKSIRKAIRFDAQDSEGKKILTSSASSVCMRSSALLARPSRPPRARWKEEQILVEFDNESKVPLSKRECSLGVGERVPLIIDRRMKASFSDRHSWSFHISNTISGRAQHCSADPVRLPMVTIVHLWTALDHAQAEGSPVRRVDYRPGSESRIIEQEQDRAREGSLPGRGYSSMVREVQASDADPDQSNLGPGIAAPDSFKLCRTARQERDGNRAIR
ncbi:hypothetical protein CERZMDRAFT_80669 [Cercospora zeae-maydis SCOH1-5]|uniref:Uncharacterized protein n=1 Tax=Cercospora zeae-maydis SCOH1-5 TaxID=717836 RepID=A0A6A6FXB4_9PEZI|nr:hypothetical protein CERZMDRAFT_80669 [Cercospora zeae-maydis SCOH1-5]